MAKTRSKKTAKKSEKKTVKTPKVRKFKKPFSGRNVKLHKSFKRSYREDYKRELERVSRRIDNLIEMRSDGEIDKADFIRHKTDAEQKHMELQNKIAELEAEQNKTTPVIDYKEKLEVLRYALEQYTNFDDDGDIPDNVVEAFVEKIVVSKDGFDWYLRFDGDPNDPIHLKTEGKRKNKTEIIDPKAAAPSGALLTTGCNQRI